MNKMQREEKGITLIALIVTIIIMLILAGVTINVAIRRQWVIKQDKRSSRKT